MGSARRLSPGLIFALTMMFSVILVAPSVMMRVTMSSYLHSSTETIPPVSAVLVPGASVVRGRPSPILAERIFAAKELYKSGKVGVILVTGAVEGRYDEVTPMRRFLVEEGIPAGDIAIDGAGIDTFSSMYRARNVFLADSLIIATQDFHLPRAVFLARALNIRAYGLAVSRAGTLFDYLREVPASWKAMFDVLTHLGSGAELPLAPLVISGVSAK